MATNSESNGSNRAPSDVAGASRLKRSDGLLATIGLSYFAWLPTVVSIGLGIVNLITGELIWFVLSSLVGLGAFLGWLIWFNVDR